jgi:hypothetical protein
MISISDAVFAKSGEDGIYHGFTWTTVMPILDSQVEAYERNHPGRPWVGTLHDPRRSLARPSTSLCNLACVGIQHHAISLYRRKR